MNPTASTNTTDLLHGDPKLPVVWPNPAIKASHICRTNFVRLILNAATVQARPHYPNAWVLDAAPKVALQVELNVAQNALTPTHYDRSAALHLSAARKRDPVPSGIASVDVLEQFLVRLYSNPKLDAASAFSSLVPDPIPEPQKPSSSWLTHLPSHQQKLDVDVQPAAQPRSKPAPKSIKLRKLNASLHPSPTIKKFIPPEVSIPLRPFSTDSSTSSVATTNAKQSNRTNPVHAAILNDVSKAPHSPFPMPDTLSPRTDSPPVTIKKPAPAKPPVPNFAIEITAPARHVKPASPPPAIILDHPNYPPLTWGITRYFIQPTTSLTLTSNSFPTVQKINSRMNPQSVLKPLASKFPAPASSSLIESLDLFSLNQSISFVCSPAVDPCALNRPVPVVVIDCVLVLTPRGIEPKNLLVVDHAGTVLYDHAGPTTLARLNLFKFVDQSSVIIGHRVDLILCALRVIHPSIIDTALMFSHKGSGPIRQIYSSVLHKPMPNKDPLDLLCNTHAMIELVCSKIANPKL